jgi:hypothetical protein
MAIPGDVDAQPRLLDLLRIIGVVAAAGVLAGCISLGNGINPSRAAPNMGYVDFYASACEVVWEISSEEWSPTVVGVRTWPGSTIRLARPAGRHTFVVTIRRGDSGSNFPTERAMTVVQVGEGMVSPVDVRCPVTGQVPVGYSDLLDINPYGWATYRTGTRLAPLYTVELVAKPSRDFARKRDMKYPSDQATTGQHRD